MKHSVSAGELQEKNMQSHLGQNCKGPGDFGIKLEGLKGSIMKAFQQVFLELI